MGESVAKVWICYGGLRCRRSDAGARAAIQNTDPPMPPHPTLGRAKPDPRFSPAKPDEVSPLSLALLAD